MFHAVDILPTLMEIVSGESLPEGLDGVSHWGAMQTDWSSTRPNTRRMVASPRDLMVYNIDDELITEIFNVQNRTGKFQVIFQTSGIFLLKENYSMFRLEFATKATSYYGESPQCFIGFIEKNMKVPP